MKIILIIISFSIVLFSSNSLSYDDNCLKNTEIKVKKENVYLGKIENVLITLYLYVKYNLFNTPSSNINNPQQSNNNFRSRFIAHAGGSIDGDTYTNSLEALNKNYEIGFRFFELDIRTTRDNVFVAVHDWLEWKNWTGYQGGFPPSIKDFNRYKINGKYTSLNIKLINSWFCEHKDAILVTDKIDRPVEFSNVFIDNKRLIMELFTWKSVIEALSIHENGGIIVMPTWSLLKIFGENKLNALLDLDIWYISASRRIVKKNKELLKLFKNHNIKVYAYHINFDAGKDEKYTICNEKQFFYGIYADKWNFDIKNICK